MKVHMVVLCGFVCTYFFVNLNKIAYLAKHEF